MRTPTFECRDALPWLRQNHDVGAIVTSLPDSHEVNMPLDVWLEWFHLALCRCMLSASHDSCAIFYQTDRKMNGHLISKASLLFEAARSACMRCLWHKIVLRRNVGDIDIYRPGYAHMIAFSRKATSGAARPDVIHAGHFKYANAAGSAAADFAARFASLTTDRLVDPFCGRGTFVHAAAALNMNTLGIDIDEKQIELCRRDIKKP